MNQTTTYAPSRTRITGCIGKGLGNVYFSHVSGFFLSDKRGTLYGEQMDSINGQLDPTDPSPVLSTNFYVSDEDPNIVSEPLDRL